MEKMLIIQIHRMQKLLIIQFLIMGKKACFGIFVHLLFLYEIVWKSMISIIFSYMKIVW